MEAACQKKKLRQFQCPVFSILCTKLKFFRKYFFIKIGDTFLYDIQSITLYLTRKTRFLFHGSDGWYFVKPVKIQNGEIEFEIWLRDVPEREKTQLIRTFNFKSSFRLNISLKLLRYLIFCFMLLVLEIL